VRDSVCPRNAALLQHLVEDGAAGHRDPAVQHDGASEQSKRTCLMGGRQPGRHHVDKCADAEGDLQADEVDHTPDALLSVLGDGAADALGEAGVGQERHDGGEGGGCKDAVVELDERGVLERVAPVEIGVVGDVAVPGVEELLLGGCETETHPGELVVDQAGVETGDKGAGHGGGEDEEGEADDGAAEDLQYRRLQSLDGLGSCSGVSQHAVLFEDVETSQNHRAVDEEGSAKVGSQTVLADTRVTTRFKEIILESALYHPPSNDTLESNHAADAYELEGRGWGDSLTSDEVDGRQKKGNTDDTAPQTVSPFHEVDLLELRERHARVEHGELGRRLVLSVLGLPGLWAPRPQRPSDRFPFGDTESRFRKSCKTSKDDNTKHAGCATQQPIGYAFRCCLGKAARLGLALGPSLSGCLHDGCPSHCLNGRTVLQRLGRLPAHSL
jgi:hypothetical protein